MTENDKLDIILEKLNAIDKRVFDIDKRVCDIDKRVCDIDKRVCDIDEKVCNIDEKVCNIDKRVHRIEITLENETNKNISLIAEGHLNLDRKLDEALKSPQPNTIYHLKVNHLDGEVKKIKEVVGIS